MSKKTITRLPGIHCPHCKNRSIVRDSVQVTDLVRELRLTCTHDDCGHTFVAQLSVIRTIRPSAKPDASVRLPMGEWRSRPASPANDDAPPLEAPPLPANDDGGVAAAIGAAFAPPMTT